MTLPELISFTSEEIKENLDQSIFYHNKVKDKNANDISSEDLEFFLYHKKNLEYFDSILQILKAIKP